MTFYTACIGIATQDIRWVKLLYSKQQRIHCMCKLFYTELKYQVHMTISSILHVRHLSSCIYTTRRTHRFFKGTSHESANLLSVHTVSRDGHEVAPARHDVTEQGKMTVVHVRTIKRDHMMQFFLHCLPHGFNSKHLRTTMVVIYTIKLTLYSCNILYFYNTGPFLIYWHIF